MAMQKIGGGGTQVDVIISFLNIAHDSTMKRIIPHKIEDKLGGVIGEITQQSMIDALKEDFNLQLI